MDNKDNKKENRKIYWCQYVGENPELAQRIKFGSVPKDTDKICLE